MPLGFDEIRCTTQYLPKGSSHYGRLQFTISPLVNSSFGLLHTRFSFDVQEGSHEGSYDFPTEHPTEHPTKPRTEVRTKRLNGCIFFFDVGTRFRVPRTSGSNTLAGQAVSQSVSQAASKPSIPKSEQAGKRPRCPRIYSLITLNSQRRLRASSGVFKPKPSFPVARSRSLARSRDAFLPSKIEQAAFPAHR